MAAPQQTNSLLSEQINQIKRAISTQSPGSGLTVLCMWGNESVLVSLEDNPLKVGRFSVNQAEIPKSGEAGSILCRREDGRNVSLAAKPSEIKELWDFAISRVRSCSQSGA